MDHTPGMRETGTSCDSPKVNSTRFAIVSGTVVAGMAAVQIYQSNGWWKDNRRSFHIREDLEYGQSVDKLGHFYGASVLTFLTSKAFRWTNLPESSSLWWGAGASIAFQTFLEIQDGFSEWGFDRVDFACNVAGGLWPVARYHWPVLQNFDVKFSYRPSPLLDNPGGTGFRGQKHLIFDDYEGQTLWLGIKVANLLPEGARDYWPGFIGVAVGYGARDVAGPNPHSIVIVGLDLDMTKIIPDDTPLLRTVGEALNFIRFPLPAVRLSPDAIWYGLYF